MEVFALDLAVRETGAAQVEQSLAKMRAEAGKTATAASTMGRQMGRTAAQMVVAGNIATGSITNLTHAVGGLALSMGPGGILAVAVGGLVVFWKRAFDTMRADVKKMQLEMVSDTRRMFALMSQAAREADLDGVRSALTDVRGGQAFVIGEQQLRLLPEQERRTALLERGLTRLREEYGRIQGVIAQAAEDERLWTASSVNRTAERAARMREQRDVLKQLLPLATEYRVAIDTLARTEGVLLSQRERLAAQERAAVNERIAAQDRLARGTTGAASASGASTVSGTRLFTAREMGAAGMRGAELPKSFGEEFRKLEAQAREESARLAYTIRETLATDIGQSVADGIVAGFAALTSSGSIGNAFRAFTGMMLGGIGDAMIKFGLASKGFAILQDRIMSALSSLNPKGALAGSLLMIAAGGVLKGAAAGMFQRGTGGTGFTTVGGGAGGGFGGSEAPATRIVFGPTSAGLAAGLTPVVAPNITVIGPNDPTAQRAIEEILRNANRRGTLR